MASFKTQASLLLGAVSLVAASLASAGNPLGGLGGGLDPSSLASGNAGNAAGVVSYCVKNNYLSGDAAGGVKDKLLGKIGGGDKAASDSDYQDGEKGVLKTGDGKSVDLSSLGGSAGGVPGVGGMKDKLTKKACDSVLDKSKSLL